MSLDDAPKKPVIWSSVPVFGSPVAAYPVIVRPSAYGIVTGDGGLLAVAQAPSGIYLPGGGQDPGEDPDTAIARETREECGLSIRLGRWRTVAIEYGTSVAENAHFEKRSTFRDAIANAVVASPTEPDHTLVWISIDDAIQQLTAPSHRWAVETWLRERTSVA